MLFHWSSERSEQKSQWRLCMNVCTSIQTGMKFWKGFVCSFQNIIYFHSRIYSFWYAKKKVNFRKPITWVSQNELPFVSFDDFVVQDRQAHSYRHIYSGAQPASQTFLVFLYDREISFRDEPLTIFLKNFTNETKNCFLVSRYSGFAARLRKKSHPQVHSWASCTL